MMILYDSIWLFMILYMLGEGCIAHFQFHEMTTIFNSLSFANMFLLQQNFFLMKLAKAEFPDSNGCGDFLPGLVLVISVAPWSKLEPGNPIGTSWNLHGMRLPQMCQKNRTFFFCGGGGGWD